MIEKFFEFFTFQVFQTQESFHLEFSSLRGWLVTGTFFDLLFFVTNDFFDELSFSLAVQMFSARVFMTTSARPILLKCGRQCIPPRPLICLSSTVLYFYHRFIRWWRSFLLKKYRHIGSIFSQELQENRLWLNNIYEALFQEFEKQIRDK